MSTLSFYLDLQETAKKLKLHVHLDGARMFNAATALNCSVGDIASFVDSGTFCLSKGLGCPIGSVVFGDSEFIEKARRLRKMLGGGMRQSGIFAAAGLFALDHHVDQLAEDHRNAKLLAAQLDDMPRMDVINKDVQTNIVYARLHHGGVNGRSEQDQLSLQADVNLILDETEAAGLRILGGYGTDGFRFVTHRDVNAVHINNLTRIIGNLLNK